MARPAAKSRRAPASHSNRQDTRDVYSDLLAEAGPSIKRSNSDERPLKRPRIGGRTKQEQVKHEQAATPVATASSSLRNEVPVDDHGFSSEHGEDEASDLEFEDVSIQQDQPDDLTSDEDINITVQPDNPSSSKTPRRAAPKVEKAVRLLAHKAHLVTLLGHCMIVNSRCNDAVAQKRVKRLLSPSMRSLLLPDDSASQFQRNHSFMNGLKHAVDAFKGAFRVDSPGMRKATWRDSQTVDDDLTTDVSIAEFRTFRAMAKSLSGSQDVGAQLFCAMLRAIGVQTRLVCSLQVLPLSTSLTKQSTPLKHTSVAYTVTPGHTPVQQGTPSPTHSARRPQKLLYPVFWTEVFDAAYQKWISVDAVVTHTISKPSKLEPPASYNLNQLVYAIAFSEDGSAKDVSRRYAKSYNAKTRRLRVDGVSKDEAKWFKELFRVFRPIVEQDGKADIEDAELAQREAREGLPTNIQDFVRHPLYALERHLRRNEVIHPRQEVGMVNAGTAAKPKMEPIFRRSCVQICHSADQWYRQGRIVKPGSQPVKLVPARRNTAKQEREEDDDNINDAESTALYTAKQTELYIPKPVTRGKVPRNAFGSVDVYVPSMVPKGGSHVQHELAKHAASILGVDAADVVVGFKFTGRKGAVVTSGVIVPTRYLEAVNAVVEGLQWEGLLASSRARSLLSLRLWRKFLQGLKIRERVESYRTEEVRDESPAVPVKALESPVPDDPLYTAGQHYEAELVDLMTVPKIKAPERGARRIIEDSSSDDESELDGQEEAGSREDRLAHLRRSVSDLAMARAQSTYDDGLGGGFMVDDTQAESLVLVGDAQSENLGGGFMVDDMQSENPGGGFVVEDDTPPVDQGGGFVVDEIITPLYDAGQGEFSPKHSAELTQLESSVQDPEPRANRQSERPTSIGADVVDRSIPADDELHAQTTDGESRLSHDPDDDEAEPDWMDSD